MQVFSQLRWKWYGTIPGRYGTVPALSVRFRKAGLLFRVDLQPVLFSDSAFERRLDENLALKENTTHTFG